MFYLLPSVVDLHYNRILAHNDVRLGIVRRTGVVRVQERVRVGSNDQVDVVSGFRSDPFIVV